MGRPRKLRARIKGWKPESHSMLKGEIAFWRNENRSGFVGVFEVEKGAPAWSERAGRFEGKVQVEINTGRTLRTEYFNTPEEGISFAEKWMGEHPEG